MANNFFDDHLTYQIWVDPAVPTTNNATVTAMSWATWAAASTGTTVLGVSNPYSANVMNQEMKEQEAKQRKVEDGRPDEVKNILRKMGYQVR